jgi:hypothetical protein
LVPSFDGGDNFIWILGPDERLWICVGFGHEAVDGCFDVGDGFEDTALQPLSR